MLTCHLSKAIYLSSAIYCSFTKANHGTHVIQNTPNISHVVMYAGNLRGYKGIEVYDWSNSCNLTLDVTSAVRLRAMRAALYLSKNAGCSINHGSSSN